MKNNLPILLTLLFILTQISLFSQSYKLIWSDEFEGTSLDLSNWTRETGGSGWGNNEWQYYTDREVNSFVGNGYLTIKAMAESYGGNNYTSARLISKNKRSFKYGKIEARIKLPYGQGIWPAFWMMGQNINTVGWPACGEIDIMEMIGGGAGRDNKVYGTTHWDNNGHQSYGLNYTLPSGNFSDDFHLFSITWDPEKIEWYVDNNKFCTFNTLPAYLSEFQQYHFILLNLAVGGNWPGYPNSSTVFPQTMLVDYVRVFQDTLGAPSINMLSPSNGSIITPGTIIELKAAASSNVGIKKVEFYQDLIKIGETSISPYSINLREVPAGCYKFSAVATTLENKTGRSDVVSVKVGNDCFRAPYTAYPQSIPGKIEAENFDIGGNNSAYYDATQGNSGGMYRGDESVDLEVCTDAGGGYNLSYVVAGEWIKYTVKVLETTNYTFNLRAATASSNWGEMKIFIDGVDVTGSMLVSSTGGWQNWVTISKAGVPLTQGIHEMKLQFVSADINVNYINVVKTANPLYLKINSPVGGESFPMGSIQEILWEGSGVETVSIGLSTDNGSTWSLVSSAFPSVLGACRFVVPSVTTSNAKVMVLDKNNTSISTTSSTFSITPSSGTGDKEITELNFSLLQNYPNPFNPSTRISYSLKEAGFTRLVVSDIIGREVAELVSEFQSPGSYSAIFDASNLTSGIYYYTLSSAGNVLSAKMLLLK